MALHSELWFPSVIWSGMVHVVDNTEFKKWHIQERMKM